MTVAVVVMHFYMDMGFSSQIKTVGKGGLSYHCSDSKKQKNLETVLVLIEPFVSIVRASERRTKLWWSHKA